MNKKTVKAIKIDNKLSLPITDEITLNSNDEFYVSQNDDGEIIYTPIQENIFSDPEYDDIDYGQSEIDFGGLRGKEDFDD